MVPDLVEGVRAAGSRDLISKSIVAPAYQGLLKEVWASGKGPVAPKALVKAMAKIDSR